MRMKSDDGEEQFLPNLRRFLRIDDNQNEIPLTQVRTIEGCLHHPSRSSLSLCCIQWIDYLWSDVNSAYNPKDREKDACDMDKPLNSYWISSSHNT